MDMSGPAQVASWLGPLAEPGSRPGDITAPHERPRRPKRPKLVRSVPRPRSRRSYPRMANPWSLTGREYHVVECVVRSLSDEMIAEEMDTSVKSVQNLLWTARTRMGVRNRAEMVGAWLRHYQTNPVPHSLAMRAKDDAFMQKLRASCQSKTF